MNECRVLKIQQKCLDHIELGVLVYSMVGVLCFGIANKGINLSSIIQIALNTLQADARLWRIKNESNYIKAQQKCWALLFKQSQ